ncbi:tail length tape measure protein [Rhodococcus phage Hiro]|uniref:Tape measure protein n=1 Tax=Rhodococcus phage Hiro TaxID=2015828 RepID=A0A222ZIH5_9CAUD|nr:tail length tape measure protein [Rhodococcus phage Hiro]ASR84205.1 tape measure protein [Rhodococcus phage Hiro]
MAGAGGVEVGRVSIRVVPNLDKFREDLKKGLEKETKGLKVKVDVEANLNGFRQRVQAATKGLKANVDVDADGKSIASTGAKLKAATKAIERSLGAVEVKTDVDTDAFQRHILSQIDKIHRKAELGLPLTVDGENLRRQLRTAVESAKEQVRAKIDVDLEGAAAARAKMRALVQEFRENVDHATMRLDLDADVDMDSFQRRVAAEVQKIKSEYDVDIPLDADGELFRRSVSSQIAALERSIKLRVPLDIEDAVKHRAAIEAQLKGLRAFIDPDLKQGSLAKLKATLLAALRSTNFGAKLELNAGEAIAKTKSVLGAAFRKVSAKVGVDVDDGKLAAGVAKVKAAFKAIRAHVNVDVDKGFFSRLLGDSKQLNNQVEHTGRQFMGMSRMGWIVAAVFALAAPAIGLVGSLLAGIPSLLAAAGVAAGVLALGWDGIKKAAESMGPAIDKLKESVSGVFEERLTPVFEKLSAALPQLEGGLKNVANGMSDMFSGIVDTATSATGMENLNAILDGTAKLFRDMTPGMNDFTEGFLNISAAGANSFSHLSGMMNDFAAQFKNSVAGVIKDGSFDSAMQGMSIAIGELLSQLDRLVVAGIGIMGSMGQPMANFFQGFGDLIVGMLPGLASFSNMLFNTLGALGTQLGTVFQTLTPALTSVFDTLSQVGVGLMNALGPALNQVAGALGPVIEGMMGALAPVLSSLMPIISNIAQQLGTVFAGVLTALGPSLNSLIGSFGQVATVLGGAFSQALNVIGPILPQIASSIGQVAAVLGQAFAQVVTALAPMLPVLAEAFAQIAAVIADVLLEAVTALAPFLPMLAEAITQVVVAIVPLLPIVVEAAASLITGLLPAVISLMPTLVSLAQMIANVVTAIAPWIQAAFQLIAVIIQVAAAIVGFLLSALGTLISTFMTLVSTVVSVAAGIVAAVGNFVSGVVGFIAGLVSSITSTWTEFWNSLMNICAELLGNIVSKVGEFPGLVLSVLGNLGSVLTGAGRALMDGLLGGIKAGLQKVLDFASGIADKIASVKGPLPYDRKVLIVNGEALMEGLRKGMANGFAPIVDDASNMAGEIKDGVEDGAASAKLEQTGFSYMESLKFGLQSGVNNILAYFKDALAGMGDDLGVDGLYDKVVKAITEDAKLQEIPLNFVVGNADQLMSDLGFGSGAIPTLIDQLLDYDPTQDARDAADKSKQGDGGQGQTHVHYHVEDVNEALDMEEARRQRELLQHG